MSILALTSNTLIGTAAAGNIEYDGQFFGTDSNASRAQLQRIARATAVTSTSGTSIDFTGIPAWVEKITVMLAGVSTSGTSPVQVQIGDSGGVETSAYIGTVGIGQNANNWIVATLSAGFAISTASGDSAASNIYSGSMILSNITGNNWVCQSTIGQSAGSAIRLHITGGNKDLSATLDRVRITTVNGTDTFDAGTVNIIYEG